MFQSKIEAYFFALHCLQNLVNGEAVSDVGRKGIEDIRIAIENHEQDPLKISRLLMSISKQLANHQNKKSLIVAAIEIGHAEYRASLYEKFLNPLGRRFESEIPIQMLLKPTPSMMQSVGFMSMQLIMAIQQVNEQDPEYGLSGPTGGFFLTSLKQCPIGFGAFDEVPDINHIVKILRENKPQMLKEIMHIHFKFALCTFRHFNFTGIAPQRPPIGKMLEIVKSLGFRSDPSIFFIRLSEDRNSYISDDLMYSNRFYHDRGRLGELVINSVDDYKLYMGLMREDDGWLNKGFPMSTPGWAPDVKLQAANLNSPYTRDLIENDAIYVSGPSGMLALFLGQMECLANFESLAEKQYYLAAITAYMVAGGFHSLHELLGPAEYFLGLVPDYLVSVPIDDCLAAPPNFHQFYAQLIQNDANFAEVYESGWLNLQAFFAESYLSRVGLTSPPLNLRKPALDAINIYLMNRDANVLGFFRSRGRQRAETVYALLLQTESPLEHLTIIYALLIGKRGKHLRTSLLIGLRFSEKEEAIDFIRTEINLLLNGAANAEKQETQVVDSIISELARYLDQAYKFKQNSVYPPLLTVLKKCSTDAFPSSSASAASSSSQFGL